MRNKNVACSVRFFVHDHEKEPIFNTGRAAEDKRANASLKIVHFLQFHLAGKVDRVGWILTHVR